MSVKKSVPTPPTKRLLTQAACLLMLAPAAPAATLLWNGGGGDDNWSTALNWSGTAFTAGDNLQFGGSTRLGTINNLAPDTLVGSIEFLNNTNPVVSAFTFGGNRILLGGDITTAAVSGGAFNATIEDVIQLDLLLNGTRTITTNNNSDKTHNLLISGVISDGGGGHGIIKAGGSRLTLSAANTYGGETTLANGVLVLSHAQALPGGTGVAGGTSALVLAGTANNGGVLGLGAGDFTRALGTGADQVRWTAHGGFAAFGADRAVNLGGAGAVVQWAAGGFVPSGSVLVLGYGNGSDAQDSSHTLDFQNPIDLNGGTRSIRVNDGNNGGALGPARIDAVLSGGVLNSTGTGALTKDGAGVLSLTAASTYTGQTRVNEGVLLLSHAQALPGGTALTGGTSNLRLQGNGGIVGLTTASGDLTRALGTGADQVQWTSGGGFAAYGEDRIVNLGGAGAQVTWGAGGFVTTGQSLTLGHASADAQVDFQNPMDLGDAIRSISTPSTNGNPLFAARISGALSGTGGIAKTGNGNLVLSATNSSFTGQVDINTNIIRVTKLADFGQDSSIGRGTAGVPILMSSQFRTGVLDYAGAGDSSNRTFRFGTTTASHNTGGILRANGTGAIIFTAPVLNDAVTGVTAARPLTLGGESTAANAITGVIQNPNGAAGVLNLIKADAGSWTLSGANTYTGSTTVNAGTLILSGASQTSTVILNSGGTLHINSAGAIGTGELDINGGATLDNSSGASVTVAAGGSARWDGNFNFGGGNNLDLSSREVFAGGSRTITLLGDAKALSFGVVTLSGGSHTITVNQTSGSKLVLGGLVLAESNQTRTQTFTGDALVEVTGPVTDGPGSGPDSLTYSGNGTLVLMGTNSYTGNTTQNAAGGTLTLAGSSTTALVTINNGRLNINHSQAIGTGILDINGGLIDNTSGSALTVATANLVTLDGNFTFGGTHNLSFANGSASTAGSRTITLQGSGRTLTFGVLSITNTVTYTVNDEGTGNTLVFGGLVLAENNQARTQTFTGSANLDINGPVTDGPGTGADGLTFTGTGLMRLMGAASYTGATTVNTPSGTLRTTATGSVGTGNLVVSQGTLELNHAAQSIAALTLGNSAAAAPATLTLGGTVLTLGGTLTYSSNTNLHAALITGGSIDLNGARTWTINSSAGLEEGIEVESVILNSDGGAGTFTKNGGGRLVLSGANTFASPFVISDGAVRLRHSGALGSTAGATTVNSSRSLELDGVSALGETLNINGSGFGGNTGALRNISGSNSWTGVIHLDGSSRVHAEAGSQLTVADVTAGGSSRNITFGGDGDLIASGRIGSGGANPVANLVKEGAGVLTLMSAANDFTGSTTISGGTLKLGASDVVTDTSSLTINAGVLDLAGFNETLNALTLGASTTTAAGNAATVLDSLGGGILRLRSNVTYNAGSAGFENAQGLISAALDLNNASRTFTVHDNPDLGVDLLITGVISNSGATASGITKDGAGTLVLSGANTYNSTTTIRNGTLRAGASEILANGASLSLDQRAGGLSAFDLAGHTETIGALTLSSGSSTAEGSLNQILSSAPGGVLKISGAVTYNAGAAGFHNGTTTISAGLDLNGATRTFTINDSANAGDDTVITGVIGNSGPSAAGLTKNNAGTLVLAGANTYDGNTTLNNGVVRAAHSQAFGSTGTVSLANTNAILELGEGVVIDRALTVSGTGDKKTLRLHSAASAAEYSGGISIAETGAGFYEVSAGAGGVLTLSGVISGTGAAGLTKEGAGTLVLGALNTHTGPTLVNAGALQVGAGAVGSTGTGNVTIASGGTLLGTGVVRGANFTLAAGATLRPGDSAADSSHGTLHFTPASASAALHDFQGSLVLGLTTATLVDATYGGTTIGSPAYHAWLDSISGAGGHDRIAFNNPDTGTGYTVNFQPASLEVAASGWAVQGGEVFNLLDWAGLATMDFSGFATGPNFRDGSGDNFSVFNLPDISASGLVWDVSRFTTSGVIVVVPEPGRAALLTLALAALTLRRRRCV